MNIRHYLKALLICAIVGCTHTDQNSVDYSTFFDTNNRPSQALCALFTAINIDCMNYDQAQRPHLKTIDELNKIAQAELLRRGERWETEKRWETQRSTILPLIQELGLQKAQLPQELTSTTITSPETEEEDQGFTFGKTAPGNTPARYDYILILGGLQARVEKRIAYLETLAQAYPKLLGKTDSDKAPTIILLTSERPLDPKQEFCALATQQVTVKQIMPQESTPQAACKQLPQTEADMVQALVKKSTLGTYTWTLLISAPMKTDPNGKLVRPTTDDTVNAWLATKPTPGRCLIISDQPFILRQALVLQTLLPKGFTLTSAGPEADEDLPVAVYLDEVARTIYQIAKIRGKA